MDERLSLRWNNQLIALQKLTKRCYLEETYSDATILCGGIFYPVHRLILSMCSKYFETMFAHCNKTNKHPFIIVKDVSSENMEAILNYIYKGEIQLLRKNLKEFMKAAEVFEIKELIADKISNQDYEESILFGILSSSDRKDIPADNLNDQFVWLKNCLL